MTLCRRKLVQLGVGALLPTTLLAGKRVAVADLAEQNVVRRLTDFGLQLSTVTSMVLQDFEATLREVAEIGYTQVEFSAMGFLGRSAEYAKGVLADTGLEAPVGRVSPVLPEGVFQMPREEAMGIFAERGQAKYLVENVTRTLKDAHVLGQRIINLPALLPSEFQSLDQVKRNIEYLNAAGEVCGKEGVMFGYHNHDWELAPIDGVIPYDLMIEQTDPDKVSFQLDSYWIVKGGGDLSDYLRRYAGRFNSCHLKDIDSNGDFEDVGHGLIDFPRFITESLEAGAEYFFVERDNPPDPGSAIRRSFEYLRNMTFE